MRRDGTTRKLRSLGFHGAIVLSLAIVFVGLNTIIDAPPRFDGAGYAVLAESLRHGQGYRAIDHPDAPRHAHFPPGYPLALAGLWSLTGTSSQAAHVLAMACTVTATLAAWLWFRRLFRPRVALGLGAALAVNWTWARNGGSIQSEPLFLLLQMGTVLAASRAGRRAASGWGVVLGLLLGTATLTRHVGIMLAPAIGIDLWMRRKGKMASVAWATMAVVVAPWAAWLVLVGRETQVELLPRNGLVGLVASQILFYVQRLPDQIVGPVVEVGTVFRPGLAWPVTAWAVVATALVGWGWWRCLRSLRRRLAGLVPLWTMPLLLVWPFTEAGRFLVPLVPFVLVGAFEGLTGLLGPKRRGRQPGQWQWCWRCRFRIRPMRLRAAAPWHRRRRTPTSTPPVSGSPDVANDPARS